MAQDIICPEESYKIIGACFDVYNDKGSGFSEPVYQECLEIELEYQQIPFIPQPEQILTYRDRQLKTHFEPDFICFRKIILEIKSVDKLNDKHRSQVFNYLKASHFQLGLLVNFGEHPKLKYERIVLSR